MVLTGPFNRERKEREKRCINNFNYKNLVGFSLLARDSEFFHGFGNYELSKRSSKLTSKETFVFLMCKDYLLHDLLKQDHKALELQ